MVNLFLGMGTHFYDSKLAKFSQVKLIISRRAIRPTIWTVTIWVLQMSNVWFLISQRSY